MSQWDSFQVDRKLEHSQVHSAVVALRSNVIGNYGFSRIYKFGMEAGHFGKVLLLRKFSHLKQYALDVVMAHFLTICLVCNRGYKIHID
jgi:hypothetical protein